MPIPSPAEPLKLGMTSQCKADTRSAVKRCSQDVGASRQGLTAHVRLQLMPPYKAPAVTCRLKGSTPQPRPSRQPCCTASLPTAGCAVSITCRRRSAARGVTLACARGRGLLESGRRVGPAAERRNGGRQAAAAPAQRSALWGRRGGGLRRPPRRAKREQQQQGQQSRTGGW